MYQRVAGIQDLIIQLSLTVFEGMNREATEREPRDLRKEPEATWLINEVGERKLAGGPGIEPGFSDPKSDVLPLDDPPTGTYDKA